MLHQLHQYLRPALFLFAVSWFFLSCTEKEPAPSAKITTRTDGNIVEFTVESEGAESYLWDFGDGSPGVQEQNPVHVFSEFGKEYIVTLTVNGPGGQTVVTETVIIRPMTDLELITGGLSNTTGQRWRLSSTAQSFAGSVDPLFTVIQTYPAGFLENIGFTNAYKDEFVFKSNGDFQIIPKGQGIISGLSYCTSKNIPNTPPGQEAISKGLTLAHPFTPPQGLKFAFNESKSLTINISDGNSSSEVLLTDLQTLSFSKGGFFAINNWMSECVILDLEESKMKVAFFTSTIPSGSQHSGKTNGVLILTFELVK